MNAAGGGEFPLWRYVWKLAGLRLRIFAKGFLRAKPGRKVLYGFLLLVLLGIFVGTFAASWAVLGLLSRPDLPAEIDLTGFQESVPALALGGAFVVILMTSFGVLLQVLYLSGDLDFLLAAPVPIRAVFVAKLTEAILPNLGLIGLFGLPILFGLGAANDYSFLYYPMTVLVLIALALAAAGLASLLVMGVVRVVPARRIAEILGFIGGILSLLCSQSGQLLRFSEISREQAMPGLQLLLSFNSPWMPLAWPGRGLVALGEGQWGGALLFLGLSLGLSLGAFGAALYVAEQLYYSGWARMQGQALRRRVRRERHGEAGAAVRGGTAGLRLIPAPVRAMLFKDYLMLRRDLRNLSQLITPLIFGLIYAFLLFRGGPSRSSDELRELSRSLGGIMKQFQLYGSIGLALFMGWSMTSRLALIGFSQEGRYYWMLKTAPIGPRTLLLSKFLVAFVPSIVLGNGLLLVLLLMQRAEGVMFLYAPAAVSFSLAGLVGVNLAFGAAGARLDWQNPNQMMGLGVGCLTPLISSLYLLLTAVFFFGPPLGAPLLELSPWMGYGLGLLLGGVLGTTCAVLPPLVVQDRVARIGEQ